MSIPYYHKLKRVIEQYNIPIRDCDIFVETGLYIGETISDMHFSGYFDSMLKVYSIEIEKKFIDACLERFTFLNEEKFSLIHGDSSVELLKISENHKDNKIFFWLDAHFSGGQTGKSKEYGECPIIGELSFLENLNKKPIVVIDDIELFGVQKDFPTIDEIKEKLSNSKHEYTLQYNKNLSCLIAS